MWTTCCAAASWPCCARSVYSNWLTNAASVFAVVWGTKADTDLLNYMFRVSTYSFVNKKELGNGRDGRLRLNESQNFKAQHPPRPWADPGPYLHIVQSRSSHSKNDWIPTWRVAELRNSFLEYSPVISDVGYVYSTDVNPSVKLSLSFSGIAFPIMIRRNQNH